MAKIEVSQLKSALLKSIAEQLDGLQGDDADAALRANPTGSAASRDLYSRNDPGDHYSRTTRFADDLIQIAGGQTTLRP